MLGLQNNFRILIDTHSSMKGSDYLTDYLLILFSMNEIALVIPEMDVVNFRHS